jgi:hypothetical protein
MILILGIDPGTTQSGWALLGPSGVESCGVLDNHLMLNLVNAGRGADILAIEMIAGMGMTVGQTTFETVRWIGRFQQAWHDPESVKLVYRRDVKNYLCGSQRAKDKNIRQALLDLVGPVGTKKEPGPCYSVKAHAWAALSVAVTARAQLEGKW